MKAKFVRCECGADYIIPISEENNKHEFQCPQRYCWKDSDKQISFEIEIAELDLVYVDFEIQAKIRKLQEEFERAERDVRYSEKTLARDQTDLESRVKKRDEISKKVKNLLNS